MQEKTATHGWCGKVLRVDLTGGKIHTEKLDPRVAKTYIGGRGLGIYYLSKEVDPACGATRPISNCSVCPQPSIG